MNDKKLKQNALPPLRIHLQQSQLGIESKHKEKDMSSNYATKQRAAILSYIEKMGDDYQSASEILDGLSALGEKMGLTTIYRHLKNLEKEGLVISNQLEGVASKSYRASNPGGKSDNIKFYLQCEDCGKVVNFECHEIGHLYAHLQKDHSFSVNPEKTIFYGHCGCKH